MNLPNSFAGIWLQEGRLSWKDDIPMPSPSPGEALIHTRLAGICGTDLELKRGYYPYTGVPGHEFVGEVISCPSAPQWEGRRVVGEINAPCRACPTCQRGMLTHCENRTVLGIVNRPGVLGSYFTLPAANLLEVSGDLPDEAAVFTEPLAAALQILEQVTLKPSHTVILVGAGRLGQLIARVLQLSLAQLLVLDPDPAKRARLEELGISTVDPAPGLEPQLKRSADFVVEASGNPVGFELARRLVRPRGTIVAKSTYHGKLELDYSALVVDEITLVGSRCGPFAPALRLLREGTVDPRPLIEARYPPEQGIAAFEHAARFGALKILIDFS